MTGNVLSMIHNQLIMENHLKKGGTIVYMSYECSELDASKHLEQFTLKSKEKYDQKNTEKTLL